MGSLFRTAAGMPQRLGLTSHAPEPAINVWLVSFNIRRGPGDAGRWADLSEERVEATIQRGCRSGGKE